MFTTERALDPTGNKLIDRKQLHLRTIFLSSDVEPQYTGMTEDLLDEFRRKCQVDVGEYVTNRNINEYIIDIPTQQVNSERKSQFFGEMIKIDQVSRELVCLKTSETILITKKLF